MSGPALMSLGTRALFAAQAQLTTIGNNIANANTVGYSRQQAVQVTTEGQFTGAGYFGRGVTVQTVTRASNIFLTQQAQATRSGAAADAARRDMLQQLEPIFGTGDAGLGAAATSLFNSFADLAAAPGDLSARQAVLARAEDVASMARSFSDQLAMVQANVRNDVQNSVGEVNTLAQQVGQYNLRIAAAMASGHTPNDLLDARDQLISQISDKIEVHTITASDGSLSLFIAGGQNLVLGGQANQLVAQPDEFDRSRVALGISVSGQTTPLAAASLSGGSLAGLLAFQNDDLADARNRLGQLAAGLALAMNDQQARGIDLSGKSGQPLFQIGKPLAVPSANNATAGSVQLAIVDPAALKASEYTLEVDAVNGGYRVTRLSDGTQFPGVPSGGTVDGFSISDPPPPASPPALGDSFLLQPTSASASAISLALGNPRSVAAGAPLTAVAALANSGTGSIGSLAIVAAPAGGYAPMALRFTDAAGGYQLLDSAGAVLTAGTWAGGPISYNGFDLTLQGNPNSGDTFVIAPSANGNALAFDAMAGRTLIDGETFADAYAQVLSDVGLRVQGAVSSADGSAVVAARAAEALTNEVGVNLDEEAAKLIQYQQAYQAAAKMLQTAQTVMDTLLQLGAR